MYTIRPDKPLNPVIVEILARVQEVTQAAGYSYLLVGATARDMLMTHVFGIESRRATHDVDFAIAVESWDQFHALKAELAARGGFAPATDKPHLLHYAPAQHGMAFPLDLIPFGGIEQGTHRIAWPPDMNVVMDVTAYAEAMASALDVAIGNNLAIRVVSIPSLAALKLLAWNDRSLQDNKDAQDLFFLLRHYHEAGNLDRMYGDAFALLEACDFDLSLAGAALLGHDAGLLLAEDSLNALLAVLTAPRKRDRLVIHMTRAAGTGSNIAVQLLNQFERGLQMKKIPAS